MMIVYLIIIVILPPPMEIFKVLSPHLGMTLEILRLIELGLNRRFAPARHVIEP